MILSRLLFFLGRACFAIFIFLTSSYCLLAYVPFTYNQMILAPSLAWLPVFARFHPYIYWGVLGMLVPTLLPDLRRRESKILAVSFLVFCAGVGVMLVFHPLLRGLRNDPQSLYWGLAFLLPLPWLAAIDWLGQRDRLRWGPSGGGEDRRIFRAAWQSAVFLSLLYSAIFYLRHKALAAAAFGLREGILSLSWTVIYHLLAFMAVFLILFLVHAAAHLFDKPPKIEFVFCDALACLLLAVILRFLIFPLISFTSAWADIFALAAGSCFGAWFAGLNAKLYPADKNSVDSGLALLLTPLRWGPILPRTGGLIPLLILALLAYFLEVQSAVLDWNYLRQKLSVLLIWTATFANFYELAPRSEKEEKNLLRTAALLFAVVASFGAYKALGIWQHHYQQQKEEGKVDVASVLGDYAGYDVSFKLLYDALAPVPENLAFYRFLIANTNIPPSSPTNPVEVNLVDHLTANNSAKPNIFIIVIDSLRRDYLSPYNPAVTFTPNIDAFARESVVEEHAFAKYAGTGLSEPSIWVGGMFPHEEYITPFYPMNALERLVETDGYRSFIANDAILKVILRPSMPMTELDCDIPGRRYDFCQTLGDLENKISAEKSSGAPIFAYAQPQNIHMWVIHNEGESVPPGESYPGFYEPYAARLRQLDLCWGKFHQFLKKSGLYDNSIVILTSDHGDLLGEGGMWGHGFGLFQKMIEIPIIIHLPPALRAHLFSNPRNVSFLTDIIPSLYYILGHRPIVQNGIFGRPLFTETPEEEAQYVRDSYLIASAYTPVYGTLKNSGHVLYVVSANEAQDFLFNLPDNANAIRKPVTDSIREENEKMIRDGISAIARFYRFEPPQ